MCTYDKNIQILHSFNLNMYIPNIHNVSFNLEYFIQIKVLWKIRIKTVYPIPLMYMKNYILKPSSIPTPLLPPPSQSTYICFTLHTIFNLYTFQHIAYAAPPQNFSYLFFRLATCCANTFAVCKHRCHRRLLTYLASCTTKIT